MEKYGTDRIKNLINEEARIMSKIAHHMTNADKIASVESVQKLEGELFAIRAQIDELHKESE